MARAATPGWWLLLACLAGVGAGLPAKTFAAMAAPTPDPAEPHALPLDPVHTRVAFRLGTRWGQRLRGTFPVRDGEVRVHGDGRRDVTVRLDSTRMQITGQPRYTRWARGPDFFDVDRHPLIEFRSERYDSALLRDGGDLRGTLTMRGISRPVRFVLEPAECPAPAQDCDVVASGSVDRTEFGMAGWRMAVGDAVRFELRVRTAEPGE